MSMITCPTCENEVSERAKFCGKCGNALRCSNTACNALLGVGMEFCEECGHPVGKVVVQSPLNTFSHNVSRQGKNYEQHTQLAMTNEAVRDLAPFIVDKVALGQSYAPMPPARRNGGAAIRNQKAIEGNLFQDENNVIDTHVIDPEAQQSNQQESGAARFFEKSGDYLVPRTKDFKGIKWAGQSRHYLVLYIAAYNILFGKPVPDKDHFKPAAEKAEIYEPGNFSKYINQQVKAFTMEVNGGYKLNDDGVKEVARIIALMDKPGGEPGFEYWKKEVGSGTERHRLNKDDKQRLDKWAEENVDLGQLDVRNIKTAQHYAMIAFWILTKKLDKAQAVHRHDADYYLRKKYTIVSVTSQTFSKAVVDDDKEIYFRKSGDNHFLSSDAIALVEGWTEGKPIEVGKPDKKEQKK